MAFYEMRAGYQWAVLAGDVADSTMLVIALWIAEIHLVVLDDDVVPVENVMRRPDPSSRRSA